MIDLTKTFVILDTLKVNIQRAFPNRQGKCKTTQQENRPQSVKCIVKDL